MIDRRRWLGLSLRAGAALVLEPRLLRVLQQAGGELIQRAIPSYGEMLPVIGLTFGNMSPSADHAALREVLRTLVDNGGSVLDLFHGNDLSEQVAATIANELGIQNRIFWSTRGSPPGPPQAGPAAARAQVERSFARLKVPTIDLVQVSVTADPAHLAVLKEMKKEGRIRYIGVTAIADPQYATLESIMRNEPIDFIGVAYAMNNRTVEETILPLARERRIGVQAYFPFNNNRGNLFRRAGTTPLPDWAADFDARTWAQFFLKYIISHPAVALVRAGTSQAKHMLDNIGGGIGRLPDEATRRRMVELVDSWPEVGSGGG